MSANADITPSPKPDTGSRWRQLAELNPILSKELRGRMRGWRSMIIMTIYLFLIAALALVFYAAAGATSSLSNPLEARVGQTVFFSIVVFEAVLVSLLSPAFTAGVITGEREKQTYEVLMTTLLTPRSIITGKLGAALAWLVLLVLSVVPFEALAFVFGGVAPEEIVIANVVLVFTALFYGVVGIFWSTIVKSTIAATVLSYATLLFFLLGVPVIWSILALFSSASSFSGSGQNWTETPLGMYLSGAWLSTNPFVAMGLSEGFLSQNKGIFFFTQTVGGQDIPVVEPWLAFCVFALLVSLLLIWLSTRALPPTRRHAAPRHVAPVLATNSAASLPEGELQISPQAEQTLTQRDEANISGAVRIRTEEQGTKTSDE